MTLSDCEPFHFIKQHHSKNRFHHSQKVAELAAQLGEKFGWNPSHAYMAGLLHDVAKEWTPQKLIHYVRRHKTPVPALSFIIQNSPNLLHAYAGSDFVKKRGWIKNKKSLKAISSHTLGSLTMSLEEKILYVADLAAPDRVYKEAKEVRRKALHNLENGFRQAVAVKIEHLLKWKKPIHPLALHVWNRVVCKWPHG